MRLCTLLAAVVFTATTLLTPPGYGLRAAPPTPGPKVGQKIADFTLNDPAGKAWSLADFKDKKVIVVIFIGTECPINNAFMPRLVELHKEYGPRGVQFLAVNANRQDTATRVAEHARKHGIPFPVLKDAGNVVADQLGAERTPEAFLLDGKRQVAYRGRIDDQFGIGFKRERPTRQDLAQAIDEVLAGKPVTQASTPIAGCFIARVVKPKAGGTVTYTKHIARILQKHCQECHRPGQIGPMPLLTYDDTVSWSKTIREVVQEKRMPPWYADPRHGKFSNERSLSKEDRATLLAWIDQGVPKGEDQDRPAAKDWPKGWTIGEPDKVFTMTDEYSIPAKADRKGLRYQYALVLPDFKEDVWVQAAEAKPGNYAVVHHIIVYVKTPGSPRGRQDGIGDGFLAAYAPGDMPAVFPPGTAKKIPKGSILIFQLHYTPTGTAQTDRSSVGLIFAKGPPKHEARTRSITQRRLAIPPGADNHKVTATSTFPKDALLLSLMPHMHLRGKSFEYQAVYPDGKSEVLLSVPHYDFNWQSNYRLEKPLRLPAGTRIECTAYFDNSAANPNNPDPNKLVSWGDQTWEEMMIGFIDYAYTDAMPGGR